MNVAAFVVLLFAIAVVGLGVTGNYRTLWQYVTGNDPITASSSDLAKQIAAANAGAAGANATVHQFLGF